MMSITAGIRTLCGFVVAGLALCAPAPASAQLFEYSRATDPSFSVAYVSRAAYDPVHDVYFVVSSGTQVTGRFVSRNGASLGTVIFDARQGGNVARVAYSPDVSNGAGGFGGFVAIWTAGLTRSGLFAQTVAFPVGLVGQPVMIRPTNLGEVESKADIAYSPQHHVFLVGLGLVFSPTRGPSTTMPTLIVRLNQNAQPIGQAVLSFDPGSSCVNLQFVLSCGEVEVEWNPISSEFGVLYSQGLEKTLARVSGDGTILSRTPLGILPLWGAMAVNTTTGNYLAIGAPLNEIGTTHGAEVSPDGELLARGLVTSSLETYSYTDAQTRLSYSAASGTFLLSGKIQDTDATRLLELNQHGVPTGTSLTLTGFPVVVAGHATAPEWLASTYGINYIIGTLTQFGGSDARPLGCITPDPFVAFGGGTCAGGGWYPPGITPPPPPIPIPGGCITPDPFVAFGGGTCVRGGWYPPGNAAAPPPPLPPVPGGCLTPDPFVAFGGGTCVNGGWYPPGNVPAPPPPPVPGGCITPDPFVAIGGGICANGGWRPRN